MTNPISSLGTFDNDMQQDAHEFLNHLLNTCADILTGLLSQFIHLYNCAKNLILAERKEEKDKHDKQRNKSNNVAISSNHVPCNGDGQHHQTTMNGDVGAGVNAFLDDTWIHELFQGTLVSTTKCLNCETVMIN